MRNLITEGRAPRVRFRFFERDFKMAIINGHYSPWAARHHLNDGVTDILSDTESEDVMHGYGGNDNIAGGGGHDVIDGGRGDDLIVGGRG
jgi:Ca2+-binding RTX toxin-like protein